MLSVEQCRALLGSDAPETDAEVEALRDLISIVAESVLDSLTARPEEAA